MPKMIVSIDGVVIKEVQLTKDRTTLGRRPYNDIVIDNLAVSGEHAVLQMTGNEVYLEDLNSTNGTYVNGKAVKKQLLQNSDTVEIGKYKIKYINEVAGPTFEKTMILKAGASAADGAAAGPGASGRSPGLRRAGAGRRPGPAQRRDQGAVGRGRRPRGAAGESGHDHRQARRRGRRDHQAPARVRGGARGGRQQADPQRRRDRRGAGRRSSTATCSSWPARRCSSCRPDSGAVPTPAAPHGRDRT